MGAIIDFDAVRQSDRARNAALKLVRFASLIDFALTLGAFALIMILWHSLYPYESIGLLVAYSAPHVGAWFAVLVLSYAASAVPARSFGWRSAALAVVLIGLAVLSLDAWQIGVRFYYRADLLPTFTGADFYKDVADTVAVLFNALLIMVDFVYVLGGTLMLTTRDYSINEQTARRAPAPLATPALPASSKVTQAPSVRKVSSSDDDDDDNAKESTALIRRGDKGLRPRRPMKAEESM